MSDLSGFGGGAPHRVDGDEAEAQGEEARGEDHSPRDAGASDGEGPEVDEDWAGVRSKTVGETTLVNLRDLDEYDSITLIDRTSRFGNPYRIEEDGGGYTREGSVRKYRLWFADKIGRDPEFKEAVEDLRGAALGCWCVPEACHGDVVLEYLSKEEEER